MATEKRLIDANALIGKARWMEEPDGNGINCDILAVSVCAIENAPTVDAVEVVHGRWRKYTDDRFNGYDNEGRIRYRKVYSYECSNCGRNVAVKSNYCPNCGANMDGDGNV